ncbi:MAG: FRG domain-containing protein [Eubacteriales bacterium]|nr:FRG domain-containing protein [Eubacteriales bacterium]
MIRYPEAKTHENRIFTGTWSRGIPVFTVTSQNDLNQLVGYVKHINAGIGTVLYRGQCNLYPRVIPSIFHDPTLRVSKEQQLEQALSCMIVDPSLIKFFNLDLPDVAGWELYKRLTMEAVLQHYGGKTFCVDFVDNHWTALWFGLFAYDKTKKAYYRRDATKKPDEDKYLNLQVDLPISKCYPDKPQDLDEARLTSKQIEKCQNNAMRSKRPYAEVVTTYLKKINDSNITKWQQCCDQIDTQNQENAMLWQHFDDDNKQGHMYLFLYVAETNAPSLNGIYFGENTYTIDLRKNLPSTFLRPCSQHGWIVRGKHCSYDFDERIACVIRINVALVDEMLGQGSLVSTDNFFPSPEYDQGYHVLLERQINSPIPAQKNREKIIPAETISCAY